MDGDVTLGLSSADVVSVPGQFTASAGLELASGQVFHMAGTNDILIANSEAAALEVKQGSTLYMVFNTSTPGVAFGQNVGPSSDSALDLGNQVYQWANVYTDKVGCHTDGALTVSGSAGVAVNGGANSDGYALELANSADTGKARAYAWATYSSARLKTNIETLDDPMDKIMQMRGVSYEWKADGTKDVGFIAEEMGQVLPEVVHFGKDGRAQSIDYSRLTSVLVEAVKSLKSEINQLKNSK
jgi:hypothetical protein